MKKHIITFTAILLMSIGNSFAQVFMIDDDDNSRSASIDLFIPQHNINNDQYDYAPVGSGTLILTCLGGAYMLTRRAKRRRDDATKKS